jgi:hypothetical protein
MGTTKDSSELPVDNWPGASGQCGRSAEAGVSRLTVWGGRQGGCHPDSASGIALFDHQGCFVDVASWQLAWVFKAA